MVNTKEVGVEVVQRPWTWAKALHLGAIWKPEMDV